MTRTRDRRMQWLERLVAPSLPESPPRQALVLQAAAGKVGVAFECVVEVLPESRLRPFALLPSAYCGVTHHDGHLVPIIDLGGPEGEAGLVAVMQAGENRVGLHFHGEPRAVDLDAAKAADDAGREWGPCGQGAGPDLPGTVLVDALAGPFLLLDGDALGAALLDGE